MTSIKRKLERVRRGLVEETEITEVDPSIDQVPHEDWPNGTLYKGESIWDMYYEGPGLKKVREELESELNLRDYQENYLGYSQNEDKFIAGFDVSFSGSGGRPAEGGSAKVEFYMSLDGRVEIENIETYGSLFYRRPYDRIKNSYPNLIGIRLD